jgi:hypothetical protein
METSINFDKKLSGFSDPATFGEDLGHNFERMKILAPVHCGDCSGYHLERVRRRLEDLAPSLAVDRHVIMEWIGGLLTHRLGRGFGTATVIIAGAADTGLLAACAHAASLVGIDCRRQVEFTVLDRCPSPLILCTEYAGKHGLAIQTKVIDFAKNQTGIAGDIVLAHSLLRFIPASLHATVLRQFGGWLEPGGHILFSNTIVPAAERWRYTPHAEELHDVAAVRDLIQRSGLRIVRQREVRWQGADTGLSRHRFVALLADQ